MRGVKFFGGGQGQQTVFFFPWGGECKFFHGEVHFFSLIFYIVLFYEGGYKKEESFLGWDKKKLRN